MLRDANSLAAFKFSHESMEGMSPLANLYFLMMLTDGNVPKT
jgi:hypothetical protein